MHQILRDPDGVDWNEPFQDLLSGQDQRVREEGYVVLGQSIISSDILDSLLFLVMLLLLMISQVNLFMEEQIILKIFSDLSVWRRMALSLTILIASTIVLSKVKRRIGPVRIAFIAQMIFTSYLLMRYHSIAIQLWLMPTLICLFTSVLAVLASPVLTLYLEYHYRKASFAHKQALARHQIDLLSDVLGRNIRKARTRELGEIMRAGFRRLASARHDALDRVDSLNIHDFQTIINNRRRSRQAFLLFAAQSGQSISKRKFLETGAEIYADWRSIRLSMTRSTAVFTVLTGLLDFCAIGLAGMFGMAVFKYSVLHLIAAALFVYGIINSFFGVAISQWKFGAYLILGRHPYDIGDMVIVPKCGKGSMRVLDYSLTTSLLRRSEGQSVSVLHRDIAFSVITNISRPKTNKVVLTLSAAEARGMPIVQVLREILKYEVADYFHQDFKIIANARRYTLDARPRIQLTFAGGLNAKQRLRGLIRFCSILKEASLEAHVEDEETDKLSVDVEEPARPARVGND